MHLNISLYLQVLKLYNFNTYLTCRCFLCLSFFFFCSVLHKKRAGNVRVTVAAMGMTWFFHQARLKNFPALKTFRTEWAAFCSRLILASVFFHLLSGLWFKKNVVLLQLNLIWFGPSAFHHCYTFFFNFEKKQVFMPNSKIWSTVFIWTLIGDEMFFLQASESNCFVVKFHIDIFQLHCCWSQMLSRATSHKHWLIRLDVVNRD